MSSRQSLTVTVSVQDICRHLPEKKYLRCLPVLHNVLFRVQDSLPYTENVRLNGFTSNRLSVLNTSPLYMATSKFRYENIKKDKQNQQKPINTCSMFNKEYLHCTPNRSTGAPSAYRD